MSFANSPLLAGGEMVEPSESNDKIVRLILKEVLDIQRRHAFDPVFSKAERQKLVVKAVEKVFKQELG